MKYADPAEKLATHSYSPPSSTIVFLRVNLLPYSVDWITARGSSANGIKPSGPKSLIKFQITGKSLGMVKQVRENSPTVKISRPVVDVMFITSAIKVMKI